MNTAYVIYQVVAVLAALVGLCVWLLASGSEDPGAKKDRRFGARMFLLAPVWPVVLLFVIGLMWGDAVSRERPHE